MLLDTSGLFCLFDASDAQHNDAVTLFWAADLRITHSYVLSEFVPLCQSRGLNRQRTLEYLADLTENPLVEVVWVDKRLHSAALALLQAQLDKQYSLCDAVSMVLLRERGLFDALTTDHHFEQAGFQKLLR